MTRAFGLVARRCALRGPVPALLLAALAGCATPPTTDVAGVAEAAPAAAPCPGGLPDGTRCLRGTDSAGAPYLIALPAGWDRGVLVVHAHGGPALGEPRPERIDEDAQRWSIALRAGYAWAGSAFRQGGVAVTSAAEDTERVRRIFVRHVATPRRTLLHGQSWGAGVAARLAEMSAAATPPGTQPPYDAVLLSSGVLGGGTRSYDFRLDLRVVYQFYCGNHPRADEPSYPLWMGLPADSRLTRAELAKRVDECLGAERPAAQRSAEQRRRLANVAAAVGIVPSSVGAHLAWATWHFQDIALKRTGGLNPFDNTGRRYAGTDDDAALNAGVARYAADPRAVAAFTADAGLSGRIGTPVLTVHATRDPTASVELEAVYREAVTRAGNADRLVQTFTSDATHSYLADPDYVALFDALLQWVDGGVKPTPESVARKCQAAEARFGPGCRFVPGP